MGPLFVREDCSFIVLAVWRGSHSIRFINRSLIWASMDEFESIVFSSGRELYPEKSYKRSRVCFKGNWYESKNKIRYIHPISKKSIKLKSREENQDRQVTSFRLDSRKSQNVAAAGDAWRTSTEAFWRKASKAWARCGASSSTGACGVSGWFFGIRFNRTGAAAAQWSIRCRCR